MGFDCPKRQRRQHDWRKTSPQRKHGFEPLAWPNCPDLRCGLKFDDIHHSGLKMIETH